MILVTSGEIHYFSPPGKKAKVWPLCNKRLKPSGAAYRRLKANKEENLTNYTRSIYKESRKIRVMMRKALTNRKSKTHNIRQ